jgi:diguanylate cyclase (GGDEF)-like protein
MTASGGHATYGLDGSAGRQTDPSPQHPQIALLLGGSLLLVVLACVVPLFVVDSVRPEMPTVVLMLAVVVALSCGVCPFLGTGMQNTRYAVAALAVLDLIPLALAATVDDDSPVRPWCSLVLIPVLLAAATLDRRLYLAELVAGCLVGVSIMLIWATEADHGLLASVGFSFFLVVCASLARQDRSTLELRFRQWQRRSRLDELTGLLNRRGFVAEFPAIQRRCADTGVPIGMVMIDIDHFSRINADHGHTRGDAVLKGLCAVVSAVPEVAEGIVARIGGEELIVVVPRPAESVALALRAALSRADVHPGLTVSMGICDADPGSCADPEAMWRLVNLTDAAMYRAKQSGRDRYERAEIPGTDTAVGVVVPAAGAPATDGQAARPVPPRLNLRPVPAAQPGPGMDAPRIGPVGPADAGDSRLFGAYCLVFAAIGALAWAIPVALDPRSGWMPLYLVGLAAMTVLGTAAVLRPRSTSPLLTGVTCVAIEVCTLSAVLATQDVEHRLMIICILTVPVLVSAQTMPLPWLAGQILLVLFGVGLAAGGADDPIDAAWMHRTLSLTAVLCAAPAVLFWLRQGRERANNRLRGLISVDPLTGVHNRGGLEHGVLNGDDVDVQVLTFDVVGFKAHNDTYGHVFGDEVLVHLARALATAVAEATAPTTAGRRGRVPVVGRTGGDHFVVVAPEPVDPVLPDRIGRMLQTFPPQVVVATGGAGGRVRTAADLWSLIAAAEATSVRPAAVRRPGPGGIAAGPAMRPDGRSSAEADPPGRS